MIGHVPDYAWLVRNYCCAFFPPHSFSFLFIVVFYRFLIEPKMTTQEGTRISNPCRRASTSKGYHPQCDNPGQWCRIQRGDITSGVNFVQDEICQTLNYVKPIQLHGFTTADAMISSVAGTKTSSPGQSTAG